MKGVKHAVAAACVVACVVLAIGAALVRRDGGVDARCGPGFGASASGCMLAPGTCPPPLERTDRICDAPDVRVLVPSCAIALGPSDWEAEGRVAPRTIRVNAFRIDAFEATRARFRVAAASSLSEDLDGRDAEAASGISRTEAAAYCASRGGRLPTEDEWIAAAASAVNPPRRYPWGDTGAVCRRGAWGLEGGPCGKGATGPSVVGAHPDGDSALGLHDVAGNVAEWIAPAGEPTQEDSRGVAKGGSWATALAADLRIWAKLELDPKSHDSRVGVRCAYPP
jgi:formylglycine-generating enzyme required for sulfatase activity